MNLIIFAALIAAGGAAKLSHSYLPPASAATAGGSAGNLQLPFSRSNQVSQGVPAGGFVNDHQGVVVDAAPAVAGVRASNQQSGLGGPRISYGSTESKVGDAAFRVSSQNQGFLNEFGEPDLSAFHKPPSSSSSSSGHSQIIRDPSHTLNYQNNIGIDNFNYAFKTNNGIKVAQNGIDMNGVQSHGSYSYVGDDGKQYSVSYTADKNGYRAQGSHLPTPHPIPPEILLSLERNAKDEAAGIIDDGSYDARKYNTEGDYTENGANDKYNDRQSNKFGNRPVFDSGFINQKQQAFVIPNYNGQFVYNTASKDSTFSKPDSFGFGSSLMQSDSRFGSNKEPSKTNVHFHSNMKQKDNQSPFSSINIMGSNNSPKPLSQQNLQVQSFQKPSFIRPSSYDVSNDGLPISPQSNFLASSSRLNQESVNSFGNGNRVSSSFGQTYENKPSQGPFDSDSLSNQQILNNQQSLNNKPNFQNTLSSSLTSSQPSTEYFGIPLSQQFPSSHQNDRFSESTGSSSFSGSSQNVEHSQNSNGFSSSFPTKQPQITLTTPLESFATTNTTEISTQTENFKIKDSDTTKIPEILSTIKEIQAFPGQLTTIGDISTSYTGTYNRQMAQASHSLNQANGADSASNTQRPSYEGSQFIQPQAPDHSYLYNPPSKPFNTPSTMPGFTFSHVASNQFNKVTPSLKPQTSIFTNTPQSAIFSTLNQGIGVTQAAISPFPSTIPIASSDLKQPTQSNSRPSQIASLNTPSVSAFSQVSPTSASASAAAQISTLPDDQTLSNFQEVQESQPQDEKPNTSQYTGEIYQYSKPTEALPTDNQKQNELTQNQKEQSGISTIQLFNLQSLTTPFEKQDTTTNDLTTSQLEGQFNSPSSHQGSKLLSDKPQIGMQDGSQFSNAVFNNKGSSIPASNQHVAPQFSFKPISSIPGKFPNQQSELGQQNIPSYFNKPESQSIQFESHSKPQIEPGNLGEKQKFSQNSGHQFGKPSVSQTTSNGFNSQNLVSQIGHQSFSNPTKGPFIQANTEALFNKFNTQTPQFNTKENTQFNQGNVNNKEGAIFQHIGTQSNFKPSTYLPPLFQSQSAGFNSQKPIAEFGQSTFSISSLPSTQFGNQQTSTTFESGIFNNKETTTPQFGTRFGNNPSTPISSSSQTQFSGLNTQSTTPQFGQPTTSNSGDLLTSTQFGQYSNSKTTTSQFEIGQQSTTSFNELPTIPPSTSEIQTTIQSSDLGEIYDYTKPAQVFISSTKDEDNSQIKPQFGAQSSTQFGQQDFSSTQKLWPSEFGQATSTVQFGESTISTSGPLSTNTPLQSTQLNTQFGQYSNSKITPSQFQIGQQSTTSFNEPSTIPPNTLETQNPSQSSEFGEIYDYTKPAQVFILSTKDEDNSQIKPQFGAQSSTQFGQQDFSSTQKLQPSEFGQATSTVQFGESTISTSGPLSTNTPLQSTQLNTQFGQYSNSKITPSQFEKGQQSTTSFNEPSTIPPNTLETQNPSQSSEFGETYDYTKPAQVFISSTKNEDNSQIKPQFGAQSSTQFGQQDFSSTQKLRPSEFMQPTSTVQFGESTISTSGPFSTNTPLQSTQLNTQFGQYSNSKITPSQFEIGQQSTTSFNEPSTIPPNTLETQNPSQSSESGEIYDYKKPTQGFISPSQKEDNSQIKSNSQFGAPSSTQFGQQALSSAQKVTPSQSLPSSSSFLGSQFSISSFNEIDTITTNVDKTESVTPAQFSTNPSTQEIQYTSISQNSDETSKGEIYNYQKPEQGLPSPSDKEGNIQFGQKIQKPMGSFISNNENFEANQQTTSQLVEPTTTFKPFNQETTQKSFESRPQLSFHRACCGGSIFNKKPLSQNNSGSSTNSFDQNKNPINQKETHIEQSLDNKKLEPQKASNFVGIPEQFGGPRKPPTFDETGYHY